MMYGAVMHARKKSANLNLNVLIKNGSFKKQWVYVNIKHATYI